MKGVMVRVPSHCLSNCINRNFFSSVEKMSMRKFRPAFPVDNIIKNKEENSI